MVEPAADTIGSLGFSIHFDENVLDPKRRPGDERELAVEPLRGGLVPLAILQSSGVAGVTFITISGVGSVGPLVALEFERIADDPVGSNLALTIENASDIDGVPLAEAALPRLDLSAQAVPEPNTSLLIATAGLAAVLGSRRFPRMAP